MLWPKYCITNVNKVLYYKSKQRYMTKVLYYKCKQRCITNVLQYKRKQSCYDQSIALQK